jgi:hypothetical protein
MQTVEVFAKPGCSREPRKIPNENPFSAEFQNKNKKVNNSNTGNHSNELITLLYIV